ncbi:MAG: MBL fold metallo-hydrolase, partial [Bacteroidetes bacterium]|nr:MBL fold metallo-hydrolase [Bacteroidota bacterium]
RIKHHVANNIDNPKNTILMVGYAEPNSIGGKIRSGAKILKIFGEEHHVRADVVIMDSYSAHGDYNEMIQYLNCQEKEQIQHLFLVHGEYETQLHYKNKLLDVGFKNISIPLQGDMVEV